MFKALQNVTLTRSDIPFSVNKACQLVASHLESHWSVIKRVIRFLSGTITHGLLISLAPLSHKFSLKAYSDLYWESDSDDCQSTSGSCIFLGSNLVSLSSKK